MEEPIKIQKQTKKQKTAYDRMKEVAFRKDGDKMVMSHKGQDLAVYIGEKPFELAKMGFEPPRLPKWKLDKAILSDIQTSRLKISDFLPHQCGLDGEVHDGHHFLIHCTTKHRSFVPSGSLVNASPYRFWLLWYSDENFIKFMETRGEPQYVKADPPWLTY